MNLVSDEEHESVQFCFFETWLIRDTNFVKHDFDLIAKLCRLLYKIDNSKQSLSVTLNDYGVLQEQINIYVNRLHI